ncbi:hypothetical protein BpHYR1_036169 [Brachionus plicatilis]|uniref:Uncharacterized protein n=1 Tax=Brachionus plicatilis TaxID=10195 RepID=A0A3M7PSF2_BRAPC|nr:hypothetical protein BpHYR1_036169 [Brachionus plicatilis]
MNEEKTKIFEKFKEWTESMPRLMPLAYHPNQIAFSRISNQIPSSSIPLLRHPLIRTFIISPKYNGKER